MRSHFLSLVGCMVVLVGSMSLAVAQRPGGGGGPGGEGGPGGRGGGMRGGMGMMGMGMMGGPGPLLQMREVQEELGISEEQGQQLRDKLSELGNQVRDSFQRGNGRPDLSAMQETMLKLGNEMEEATAEILDPDQFDRMLGLMIQMDPVAALRSTSVQSALEISDKQKGQIDDAFTANGEKMRELFSGGFGPDMREKMTEMRDELKTTVLGVLSDDQNEKMEELNGEEFEFPEQRGFGGRMGRGGDRGEGGRGGRRERGGRGGEGRGGDREIN